MVGSWANSGRLSAIFNWHVQHDHLFVFERVVFFYDQIKCIENYCLRLKFYDLQYSHKIYKVIHRRMIMRIFHLYAFHIINYNITE